MNVPSNLDPTEFGCDTRAALIVAVVDGQLSRLEIERLQSKIEADPSLRKEIERARCLRALVSTLPRVAPPAHVAAYTERLARLAAQRGIGRSRSESMGRTSESVPSIEAVLGALPIRSAPDGIADAVFARVRAARASRALAQRKMTRRRAMAGIAAAFLAAATTNLVNLSPTRAKSGRVFSFEVVSVGLTGSSAIAFGEASRAELGLRRPTGDAR